MVAARGERSVADPAPRGSAPAPEGLYVHVPFCVSLCPYCDFVVYTGRSARGQASRVPSFLEALHTEIDLRADGLDAAHGPPAAAGRPALDSVYLGGGTPSLLAPRDVADVLARVARRFGVAPGAEITLEANPGPEEVGDLAGFRAAGVTRLSLGAQAMDEQTLRRLGRRHRPSDVVAAVALARRAGFGSLSLDLLTDLPGQVEAHWRRTLATALELGPDHLSIYALSLGDPEAEGLTGPDGDHLPVRPGARRWREEARRAQDEDRAAAMEDITDELAMSAGLARYEIANHARPGHASRHNLLYWRRRPWAAVGPGAHAFDGAARRSWTTARLDRYLRSLLPHGGPPTLPPGGEDVLRPGEAVTEEAMLGLRLTEGIGVALAGHPLVAPAVAWAVAEGLAECSTGGSGGRVRLTRRGRLLADEIFVRLGPGPRPGSGPRLADPAVGRPG
jgi:oxygen-independent coproporphyrinogen III oxidase